MVSTAALQATTVCFGLASVRDGVVDKAVVRVQASPRQAGTVKCQSEGSQCSLTFACLSVYRAL